MHMHRSALVIEKIKVKITKVGRVYRRLGTPAKKVQQIRKCQFLPAATARWSINAIFFFCTTNSWNMVALKLYSLIETNELNMTPMGFPDFELPRF